MGELYRGAGAMRYKLEQSANNLVVVFEREINPEDNAALKELIRSRAEAECVILDLASVSLITTPGLGLLVSLHKCCIEQKKRLVLTGISPYIMEILDLTRLTRVFEIVARREDALN